MLSKFRCTLPAFLLLNAAFALAQDTAPSAPSLTSATLAEMRKVQQAALTSDYSWQQTAYLSDNIGPRANGSPQQQAAVEYVASEMRKLGLDVRLEKVTIPHWVRGEERAELVAYPGQVKGTTQKLALSALGGSVATPSDGIVTDVVVVRSFDELKALGRDKVAGKIVVFNRAFDLRMAASGYALDAYGEVAAYRHGAPAAAASLGAVAAIVRSAGGANYRLPHTGGTGYPKEGAKIPAASIVAEDADLIDRLSRQGAVRMHLLLTPKTLPDATTYNVIGDLKGSDRPEQIVIVSGHLDSWDLGTGAIDDAAGVAVAMDSVRIIKQLGLKPKRTIRVIAWAAEEVGVYGGIAYAAGHRSEMENHYAAIESDLGAGHPVGIYVNSNSTILAALKPVGEVLRDSGAGIIRVAEETGADLIPLGVAGVPLFSPIQDSRKYFDYHHTPADTLDKIDPKELRENAAVMSVLVYALANMEATLPRTPKPVPEWMK